LVKISFPLLLILSIAFSSGINFPHSITPNIVPSSAFLTTQPIRLLSWMMHWNVPSVITLGVYFYYDEYRYKVGRVKYGYAVIDNSYFEELSGAVIQGDTLWGSVTPDWYFTATAEPTTESKLIATPNPTFGYATLQIPEAVDYGVIQLFSADGRCVRTHDFQNLKLVSLDLTALPTGNYFVILRSEGMIWQAHLAKNSE
jgi:hypothetical protein